MAPVDERPVEHEVADVVEARARDRANPVDDVGHAIGRGEHVVAVVARIEDVLRIHECRHVESGECERSRGDVHQVDEVGAAHARFHHVLQAGGDHDQRNPQAFVVAELLAARQVGTVIGEEHGDGVLPEPIRLQLRHDLPHLVVGSQRGVVVGRDVSANLEDIGILRGYSNILRSNRR